jgi:hypothetical protein
VTRGSILPAALTGSALIGVVVVAGGLLLAGLNNAQGWSALYAVPIALTLAVPIGFVVSFLPNLAGTALLAWAGHGNIGARLPITWALFGGASGGTAGWLLGPDEAGALAAIGAASALLCRWKIAWNDDAVMKEACDEPDRPRPARAVARPRPHAPDRWLD